MAKKAKEASKRPIKVPRKGTPKHSVFEAFVKNGETAALKCAAKHKLACGSVVKWFYDFRKLGFEAPAVSPPEQAALMKSEIKTLGKLLRKRAKDIAGMRDQWTTNAMPHLAAARMWLAMIEKHDSDA